MSNMLTQEEVLELYGHIELRFDHYYKYSFQYLYEDDEVTISGSLGGDSDDIYKTRIDADDTCFVEDFEDELNYLSIRVNGMEVFLYRDY